MHIEGGRVQCRYSNRLVPSIAWQQNMELLKVMGCLFWGTPYSQCDCETRPGMHSFSAHLCWFLSSVSRQMPQYWLR